MVMSDYNLQIIDFQGARMGPSAYDVASILWDPYYRLQDNMREKLVDYYISKIEDKFDADYFRETLSVCRLQRHMQALGAYGYLSSVKEKKYFLKYVPEGLRLLKEDTSLLKDMYPELYKLVMKLQGRPGGSPPFRALGRSWKRAIHRMPLQNPHSLFEQIIQLLTFIGNLPENICQLFFSKGFCLRHPFAVRFDMGLVMLYPVFKQVF
jgi:hypothetical protein